MSYEHGVRISEVPTGVRPPVRVSAGLPVAVGTAPVNLGDVANVNKPVLVYTLAEAVEQLGYNAEADWDDYTLCEVIKSHFALYAMAPLVLVNVLDPDDEDHVAEVTGEAHVLDADGQATLTNFGVLSSTVVVKHLGATKTLNTDYTLAFDDDGYLVVTRVAAGTIPAGATITADYTRFDPTGVTADDIIGGYVGGVYTGLEVVEQVYPSTRLVPGIILAPKWSQEPTVAARMATIGASINGAFKAMAAVDLSSDPYEIADYADAPSWKSDNGYTSLQQIVCWGKVKQGDDAYHMSTHVAGIANYVDSLHDGVPYASPSNKDIEGTAMVLDDGTEVLLTKPQANYLNGQGIVTMLNGFAGWRLWGNRTGAYPGNTDPKDAFIPLRRMVNWVSNTVILTVDRDVDEPGNRRLLDNVLGTIQNWFNTLIAAGALVAGTIEFREDENSTTEMADGHYAFHLTVTPPSPARDLEFIVEYDAEALEALFE